METNKIISKSLEHSKFSSIHEPTNDLITKLNNMKTSEILFEYSNNGNHEFCELVDNLLNSSKIPHEDKIQELSSMIYTITNYLKLSTKNNNFKSLLIFLLSQHPQVNIVGLLEFDKVSKNWMINLMKSAFAFLQKYKFKIKPYYPLGDLIEKINNELNNDNTISDNYVIIDSLEKYNIEHELLKKLVNFIYDYNLPNFLNSISKIENIPTFILFLEKLSKIELYQISNDNPTNKWLNFELIRQISKRKKENFNEEDCIEIQKILKRMHEQNYDFFKQTIQYFHKNNLFNASLGKLLSSLPNSDVEEIFHECFEIDKSDSNLKCRTTLLNHFKDNADDDKFKFFVSIVFKKWEEFLKKSMGSEKFYFKGLMLTDFCNFIVHYYMMLTDEEIINQIHDSFNNIKYIDSEWFISLSKQITKLSLYYSKLYLLSYAYHGKKINNNEIGDLFTDFKENEIIIRRLSNFNEEQFKNLIKSINEIEINLNQ